MITVIRNSKRAVCSSRSDQDDDTRAVSTIGGGLCRILPRPQWPLRDRMDAQGGGEFDGQLRDLVSQHCPLGSSHCRLGQGNLGIPRGQDTLTQQRQRQCLCLPWAVGRSKNAQSFSHTLQTQKNEEETMQFGLLVVPRQSGAA